MKYISSDLMDYIGSQDIKGFVHSVFENTVNIETDDDFLISIMRSEYDIGPMSLTLDDMEFSLLCLNEGDKIYIYDYNLKVPNRNININLNNHLVWETFPSVSSDCRSITEIYESLRIIEDAIVSFGDLRALAPLAFNLYDHFEGIRPYANRDIKLNTYSEYIKPKFCRLIKSIYSLNLEEINKSAKKVIGYGPGLTPSMDDLLSGMMISFIYSSKYLGLDLEFILEITNEIIRNTDHKTTRVSAEMMKNASAGNCSKKIKTLMQTLHHSENDLLKKVKDIMDLGATSGTDTVAGIYLGIQIMLDDDMRGKLQ